jgi:hypothetical protein
VLLGEGEEVGGGFRAFRRKKRLFENPLPYLKVGALFSPADIFFRLSGERILRVAM